MPSDLTCESWQLAAAAQKSLAGLLDLITGSTSRSGFQRDYRAKVRLLEAAISECSRKKNRGHPNSVVLDKVMRSMFPQERQLSRRFLACDLVCDNNFSSPETNKEEICSIFTSWKEK